MISDVIFISIVFFEFEMDVFLSPPKPPSETEQELARQLRERISDLGLDEDYLQPKNLVRFIRARNENLDNAEDMVRKNIEWTEEIKLDRLLSWEPPSIFQDSIPWHICSLDDFGGPIVIARIGLWEPSAFAGMKDLLVRYFLLTMERGRKTFLPRIREREYIPQFTVIVDLEGLSWKHYISYDGIQAALTILKYFEANYPGFLRVGFALNCPAILGIFWKLIKSLIPETTREKIHFLYTDEKAVWRESLLQYFSEDKFPQRYGGSLPDNIEIPMEKKNSTDSSTTTTSTTDENGNDDMDAYGSS